MLLLYAQCLSEVGVWLPRTSNVLRRLRLRAFSDSLQACGRSSSRYFTRSDFWSSRAPCCPWRSWRSATNWPSSVDRGARVFASRQPIESCGRGSRRHGAAGTRRSQPLRNTFPENDAPRYLRHDRDSVLADVATTIERMNIQEVRTAPRSPWQNAYVERVIGHSGVSASITSSWSTPPGCIDLLQRMSPTTCSRERTWHWRRMRRSRVRSCPRRSGGSW